MRPEFENPKCLSENRLPARTIMLPAQKENVHYINKTESDRIRLLNGDWRFFYTEEEDLLPADFMSPDTDDTNWDTVPVPSEWQFLGYGKPRYVNTNYPFPFNPPYIGNYNPVGVYRTRFTLDKAAKKRDVILHFDGVDGAFCVYVNGRYIGFSKGSRLASEFDITDALSPDGENLLCVQVYTYADSSYLECQDMWMANGIIRDVYLIYQNKVCLWDYEITTTMSTVSVVLYPNRPNTDLRAEVFFDRRTRKTDLHTESAVKFELPSPELWNAEDPYLYDLVIRVYQGDTETEVYSKKVGLRESAIIDGLFCVNGKPVVFCGANRHEYRPGKCRAISVDDIREDLLLLKKFNFNAIRTSHYPQHPAFYELCNEMGIYVADEADIETHGCNVAGDQGWLAKHPDWKEAFQDRVERTYMRDRNETCIVVWSIGNECGVGQNIEDSAAWLRARRNAKPILQAQDDQENPRFSDFRQYGYPAMEVVRRYAAQESDFPALMTEYGHAMGNSPGALADIWDVLDETPQLQGGFIWEFRSHGFEKTLPDGTKTYLYGGDFDEGPNWANFVIDGFCFSDGTPKPSLYELKYLMSPVRIREKDGQIVMRSKNVFTRLDHCTMLWNLCEDTKIICEGTQTGICFAPGETVKLPFPASVPENPVPGAAYRVNVMLFCGERDLGYAQFTLAEIPAQPYAPAKAAVTAEEAGRTVTVRTPDVTAVFTDGMLCRLEKNGAVLLDKPMRMSFYRANTDNDGIVRGPRSRHFLDVWDNARLDMMFYKEEKRTVTVTDSAAVIASVGKIVAEGRWAGFYAEITYTVHADGTVLTEIKGNPYGMLPEVLPRIGVVFDTPKDFDCVKWYGRGWQENYPDRKACTLIGAYEGNAADMSVLYDRPQENGCRCDTRYTALTQKNGEGLLFCGTSPFSFSLHDYTLDALRHAMHRHELVKDPGNNHLYLDYAVRGLGSRSCGPEPEPEYELHPHAFTFAFTVSPYAGEEDALAHVRRDYGVRSEARSEAYRFPEENVVKRRENFDCRQ